MASKLTVEDGLLVAGEHLVIIIYPEGDCDTFDFPLRGDEKEICGKLALALYDMRETGQIEDGDTVILPDGVEFSISYWLPKE